jgi:hypothetical protein
MSTHPRIESDHVIAKLSMYETVGADTSVSVLVELVDELENVYQQRGSVVGPTTHDDRRGNFRLT